jgi:NADPH:quinone reductase-like Zn-dependent oxidoreductase
MMKAVILTAYGDVDRLEVQDVPEPTVGPGEVKVRVAAASINPIDWHIRSGALKTPIPVDLPSMMGRDASGVVVEVGPGVRSLAQGMRVMGFVMGANERIVNVGVVGFRMGSYAQFVVAKAEAWAELPAGLDLVDAAALPLVSLTGSQLVNEVVQPRSGDTLLVTGAVGGVGRAAVFTARSLGAKVWAGVRRARMQEAAMLGVDGILALDDMDLDAVPMFDAIADTVGGETVHRLLGKVKPGGTIGSVLEPPAGARERGFVVRSMYVHYDPIRLAEIGQAAQAGTFAVPVARRFPLAEVRAAQKLAEKGVSGKVLLTL